MKNIHEQISRNPILRQYENSKSTKDMQVTIDPVAAEAIEVAKQNEEIARKALEHNLKTAEELITYNKKEGPKDPEVEKLTLSESLFDTVAHDDVVGYIIDSLNNIRNAIDADGMVPTRKAFTTAFKQFLHRADLDENLSAVRQDELKSDIYNALADVCFDYSDDDISQHDIELAIDWFLTHFFDSDDSVFLTESKDSSEEIKGPMTLIVCDAEGNELVNKKLKSKKPLLDKIQTAKSTKEATTIEVKAPAGFKTGTCYFAIRDDENDPWDEIQNDIDLACSINANEGFMVEAILNELDASAGSPDRNYWLISKSNVPAKDRFEVEDIATTDNYIRVKIREDRADKDRNFLAEVSQAYKAKYEEDNGIVKLYYKENI